MGLCGRFLGIGLALGACSAPGGGGGEALGRATLGSNDPGVSDSAPFSAWAERAVLTPSGNPRAQILSASLGGACLAGGADNTCYAAIGTNLGVAVYAYSKLERGAPPSWYWDFGTAISGDSVSLSGDRLAIGNADGVRVYQRQLGTWLHLGSLIAMRGMPTFGSSVSLDGDTLVVGANDSSPDSGGEGRAYVYELSAGEWALDGTLGTEAGVGVASSKFGVCVGISDGTVAVGQTPPDQPGRIHLYDRGVSGWELVDTLSPRDPEAPENALGGEPPELFGYSLSLSGDRLVGRAAGVTQVFEREATSDGFVWNYDSSTTVLGASSVHQRSVAIHGSNVIVGEPRLGTLLEGAVRPWQGTNPPPAAPWDAVTGYIRENPPIAGAEFGRVVAVRGSWLLAANTEHARVYTKIAF